MKNKILICIASIIIILICAVVFMKALDGQSDEKEININNGKINIVTSLEDKISDNTVWCGTFNLIWNDLKNDLAKQDIKFDENSSIVDNLNKGTFTVKELSEESFYKTYGVASLDLKEKIEKAIKEKFNETSDILDSFEWENHSDKDYFLYVMLKKDFEYPKEFDKLENGNFENYNNVKYFGVTGKSKEEVREQVEVLYYNSENDFAVKLKTKGNDEIVVSVGNEEDNFLDIYNTIIRKSEQYKGGKILRNNDKFKMPYISFDLNKEIEEVENKLFEFANGEEYIISKALQTIQFELDEKGGKIKSEAGMMVNKSTSIVPQEPRIFNVDKEFAIFLIETEKQLPYFAAKISDITTVQSNVKTSGENLENSNENNMGNNTLPFVPDGMEIASGELKSDKVEEISYNRDVNKVTVEVLEDTVTSNGVTIIVTDENENYYGWGKSYKVQQKINGKWEDLKSKTEMIFEEIAYILDDNAQFKQKIDWTRFYGELKQGTYRIVKDTYDNGYKSFYSDEFEIK